MKKMLIGVFILLIASITLVSTLVSAFTASISNPRVVLYTNLSDGKYPTLTNSVVANNNNEGEVSIFITPKGVWKSRVNISETNFDLDAGERKEISYTINIDEAGYYQGDIVVTFTESSNKNTLSVVQDLVVIAQDKDGKVPGEIKNGENSISNLKIIIVGILILLILLGVIFGIKKGINKR